MENWRSDKITEGTWGLRQRWTDGECGRAATHHELEVLSWTTETGKRFKARMCGMVCSGEVEALSRAVAAQSGRIGVRIRGRWSGGVVEVHLRTADR